jgi:glycosyltransferase involved in cell wall biosynthesis
MKILFFTDHFRPEPSAPAAHVYERAKLWVEWGHEVTVITSAPNFPEGKVYPGYENRWRFVEEMDGIKVVRVKTFIVPNEGFLLRIMDYMSYMVSAFTFAFAETRPDVVISTSPHIFVPVAAVASSALRRVPHVFELRDLWPASIIVNTDLSRGLAYRMLERLELTLYRRSARILSLTRSFAEDLVRRGIPSSKIDVVVNGANLALFAPQPKDSELAQELALDGSFVIGYLGTLGLSQGLENVVEAADLLRDQPVTFLFVGAGAAKQTLEDAVKERRLDNVIFVGRQLKEAMPRYWSVCDLSLVHLKNAPVFATVIPSKIFESMAMGLPILYVGPEGEGSGIVEEHEAGVVVPPDDPGAFAGAVRALVENPTLCERLAERSLDAAPLYSRERQARDSLRVLQAAVSQALKVG